MKPTKLKWQTSLAGQLQLKLIFHGKNSKKKKQITEIFCNH